MRYARQHAVASEIDCRIPRQRRGSTQNLFRAAVSSFRLHGLSFDDSVRRAMALMQTSDPGFVPDIRPR